MVRTAYRTKMSGFDAVQCTQANARAIDKFLTERGADILQIYGDDGEYQLYISPLPPSRTFHVSTGDWLISAADGVVHRMDDYWFKELFEAED
jgi:hypothetical protein